MSLTDDLTKAAEAFGVGDQDVAGSATEERGGSSKIRIQYYRSHIAFPKKQKEIVRSLGLTKLNQVVERLDTPATRGAVAKVPHLLRIVE